MATLVVAIGLGVGFGIVRSFLVMMGGAFVVLMGWWECRSWFGGVTGDILGATNEVIEILFLLSIPLVLRLP